MITKKKIAIVALVALIVVALLIVRYVRRSDNDHELLLSGNVEVTEANLGFKLPGRVVELLVQEGDVVKAGQTIARLDSAEVAAAVAQGRAVLEEATTRLGELRAGSRTQEIGQAGAQAATQEAELTRSRKDFERAEMLYENGAISSSQFDSAKSAYETRAAQHRNALETLSLVKEGPRQEDIRIAGHRVGQAKAALDAVKQRLNDTVLVAPFAGVVLTKNVELGETVGQGTPVYTVGDLLSPWVKVYVPESRLGLVKLGQQAEVRTDSFPKKVYEGRVSLIYSEAEFTPKQVQTQEERVKLVFGVKITLKNENSELKPGMPADVMIRLQ
jgi:HlyD family secretion protein